MAEKSTPTTAPGRISIIICDEMRPILRFQSSIDDRDVGSHTCSARYIRCGQTSNRECATLGSGTCAHTDTKSRPPEICARQECVARKRSAPLGCTRIECSSKRSPGRAVFIPTSGSRKRVTVNSKRKCTQTTQHDTFTLHAIFIRLCHSAPMHTCACCRVAHSRMSSEDGAPIPPAARVGIATCN